MDPNRFDHLTKSLASGLSRRRVLGGVLGAVGGALGLRGAASAAFCHGLGGTCATKANCCGSAVCVSGTCQPPFSGGGAGCLPGFTSCGGQCKLLLNDTQNCGACGNVCPADQPVCGGRCLCTDTSCPAGQSCCGGNCHDLATDNQNCGACGNVCSGTTTCSSGTCVQKCTLDPTVCSSTEVCDASKGCIPGTCATYTLDSSTQCHQDTTNNGCATANPLSTGDEAPTTNGYPTCSWSCPNPGSFWAVCDSSGCICQHFD